MEHDYFGWVDVDDDGHLFWSDEVEIADALVAVTMTAEVAASVDPVVLDLAAVVLASLEELDRRARESMVAELSKDTTATVAYVDDVLNRMGPSLADNLLDISGDIAIDIIRSLSLLSVDLRLDRIDEFEAFALFRYALDPDEDATVLAVTLDANGNPNGVTTAPLD
jgi:hypothetical protein